MSVLFYFLHNMSYDTTVEVARYGATSAGATEQQYLALCRASLTETTLE